MTVRVSFMGMTPCDALAVEGMESNTSSHCFTLDRQSGFDPRLEASPHVRHVESGALQNARGDGGSSAPQTLSHHRLALVEAVDVAEQFAKESVFGSGEMPFVELRECPHVEQLHFAAFNPGAQLLGSCRWVRRDTQTCLANGSGVEVAADIVDSD